MSEQEVRDTIADLADELSEKQETIRQLEREVTSLRSMLGDAKTTFDSLAESCADMLRTLS
jgi:predicted  nucleic acid-binding Zn-ribbon protein